MIQTTMLPSTDIGAPEDTVGAQLDNEMATLQDQIASLKAQRKLQATAILSAHTSQSILARLRATKTTPNPAKPSQQETDISPLAFANSVQQAHNRENLYRACASITTFRVQDPDPNAVDGGKVLGIRIDVSSSGKFARPYYVMLNKPLSGSELLRVHRHTVPPCIPLATLAAQHLPSPKVSGDIVKAKKQDLSRFIKTLRRELVSYHNRASVIKSLRKEFKLDAEANNGKGKERERVIVDISAADAEAKQVRIEWVDGRIGRCVVGDRGQLDKCVVIGEHGRDREVERRVLGDAGDSRMEHIGQRLNEGIY